MPSGSCEPQRALASALDCARKRQHVVLERVRKQQFDGAGVAAVRCNVQGSCAVGVSLGESLGAAGTRVACRQQLWDDDGGGGGGQGAGCVERGNVLGVGLKKQLAVRSSENL